MNFYQQFIRFNRQQIFSMNFMMALHKNQLVSKFPIDASFYRLESLVLRSIEPVVLTSLLPKLRCLPRFFSLTIDTWSTLKELHDVYRFYQN